MSSIITSFIKYLQWNIHLIINQQQNSTSLAQGPHHTTIYFIIIKSPTTSSPRKVIHKGTKFKNI